MTLDTKISFDQSPNSKSPSQETNPSEGYPIQTSGNYASNTQDANISTVSSDYRLQVTPTSQGLPLSESGGDSPPAPSQGVQMEIEDSSKSNPLYTPKQKLKKCLRSYETLPPKTRKTIRIAGIGIGSILALLAIFFIARLSEQNDNNGKAVFLEHELEKELEINIEQSRVLNNEEDEDKSSLQSQEKIKNPSKVYKDENGKAKQSKKNTEQRRRPVFPYVDIDRIKEKRNLFHAANETEIAQTLDRVRFNVNRDRKQIQNKELRLWEPGDEPLRILLVSTWRSGSTFLGQILQSHPGVYQHHEPLSYIGLNQVRSGKEAFQAQQLLHRLLDCKYEGLEDYMNYTKRHAEEIIGHNTVVWKSCKEGPNRRACLDPNYLSEACKLFPIQLVKTVRLRLNLTQLLLNDQKLRVKVLFLVRDPRGVMSSRYSSVSWCLASKDCTSPESLCRDMQGDLKVAAAFEKLYPDRFLKVKYEDLAADTEKEVRHILSFLGLEYSDSVKSFLKEKTSKDLDAPWSISRKSSDRIALWKKQLPLQEIHEVQNACGAVLKTLKYEILGV